SMAACKRMAEEKKLPVRFMGRLQKKHWIELAAQFDIFLNTTNVDNTPVSVIEAMALGLPIVSTDVGGIPFLLSEQKNALLVPPRDAVKMARAVEELLSEPAKAQRLAAAARKKAEDFDWKRVKLQWHQLLS
ncbi:glycosyltransferase, partial [Longispora fulva]|uniref:glycosyltransferase n=2 Tax=Bacteria TaxID=2 RepID=UPI00364012D4